MPNPLKLMMGTAGAGGDTGTGQLWSWGLGLRGVRGSSDILNTSSPVQVGDLTDWKTVTGGSYFGVAIKTDNTMWNWGDGREGQLGHGNVISTSSPVQVGSLTTWSVVATGEPTGDMGVTIAVKTDGTLWTWGAGFNGCRGSGDVLNTSSPTQVGSLTTWETVACRMATIIATKTDGTLWAWGKGAYIGDGTSISRSSPVQIGDLTDWARGNGKIAVSGKQAGAIKTDGTLWVWGYNFLGQLGLGDTTSRNSPVQVGSLTDWKSINTFTQLSVNRGGFLAVKTDGTLWSWGYGSYGGLGQGNVIKYSSPVQIGSSTDWDITTANSKGGQVMAIKTSGALFAWGYNLRQYVSPARGGQLGLGDIISRSSPVQVGTDKWAWFGLSQWTSMAIRK